MPNNHCRDSDQMLRQQSLHLNKPGLSAVLTFTWSLMLHKVRMAGSVKLQRSIEGCRERQVWADHAGRGENVWLDRCDAAKVSKEPM